MQAEQLKQKEEVLAERNSYVGKLEWRLLCQHRALEEQRGRAAPGTGKPPVREPYMTGQLQISSHGDQHSANMKGQQATAGTYI
jgi:hypothetical protein